MLTEIVAAVEDQNVDTKQLSILALKSMGEMSYLVPLLSRKDDPAVRRGTLAAIRSYTALGPAASGTVREQLVAEFGEEKASVVGKMLVGFSPQETANPQLLAQLVALLSPEEESVGVRELALDTLRHLTGRDSEGYDPDHPEGKGLSAWIDLEAPGQAQAACRHPSNQGEVEDAVRCGIVYLVGKDALEGIFSARDSSSDHPRQAFPFGQAGRVMQLL